MSERQASQGKAQTKPHHPSRLRNEVLADGIDDEYGGDDGLFDVPHSDTIVPETQFDNVAVDGDDFGDDLRPDADRSEQSMSPRSAALISRTQVVKKAEPSSTAVNVQYLSRRSQNEPSELLPEFAFKPARKTPLTQDPKLKPAVISDAAVPIVTSAAPESGLVSPERGKLEETRRGSAQANPDIFISSVQEEEEPPTPTLPELELKNDNVQAAFPPIQESVVRHSPLPVDDGILDIVPNSHADDPRIDGIKTSLNHVANLVETARPNAGPRVNSGPKGLHGKKSKKGRKRKHGQSRGETWPPGTIYAADRAPSREKRAVEQVENGEFLNPLVENTSLEHVENGSLIDMVSLQYLEDAQANNATYWNGPDTDRAKIPPQDTESRDVSDGPGKLSGGEQEYEQDIAPSTPPSQSPTKPITPVLDHQQEALPATPPSHAQENAVIHGSREYQKPVPATPALYALMNGADCAINCDEDQETARHEGPNDPLHAPTRPTKTIENDHVDAQRSSRGEADGQRSIEVFDDTLHSIGARGPGRINKKRKKPRDGGPPHLTLTPPRNPSHSMLSTDSDAIVKMVQFALSTKESNVRDTIASNAKAHETAISSLQATIGYQDNMIRCQKAENERLRGLAVRVEEKVATHLASLDKHATGIGKDYDKINAGFQKHQRYCTPALKKMKDELESEKSALAKEFTVAIDRVESNRRNMKSVLDDCYARLVTSESKKLELVKQLSSLRHSCKEEKKRRSELEQQVMPTLKCLQEHVESSRNALANKLGSIQGCLDDTTASEQRDARLKQCVDTLNSLQATPLLTTKHLEKAEGALRFAYTSIGTKLDTVNTSVQRERFPLQDIQRCLQDQLQRLRSEVLKHDEVVAEFRKSETANGLLLQQIDAQKEHCKQLEEHIRGHRQSEENLELRYTQLEQEHNDLRGAAHNHDSDLSKAEEDLTSMRRQMSELEDAVSFKTMELGHEKHRCQERGEEVTKFRQLATEQKTQIVELMKQIQERQTTEAPAESRSIDESHQTLLEDAKLSLENDLRQLRAEKDQLEASMLDLNREAELAREKMQRIEEDNRTFSLENEELRKANVAADDELKKLRQALAKGSTLAATLANCKQQLAQKTTDCQLKERQLSDLQNEHTTLKSNSTTREEEKKRLESKLAETLTTVGTVQKALDARVEAHEKDAAAVQELQSRAKLWRKEKHDMEASVERAQTTESMFNDAQARFSVEKNNFNTRSTELQATLQTTEQELQRTQLNLTEQAKRAKEIRDTEVQELKRRLIWAETAVKEADARTQRVLDEKNRQFEDHKRTIDQKVEDLVREKMAVKERERHRQAALHQSTLPLDAPQGPSTAMKPSTTGMQIAHAGHSRKKVVRQNNSVLNLVGPSRPSPVHEPAEITGAEEEADVVMAGDLGRLERLDENGVSAANHSHGADVDTQQSLTMTFDQFNIDMTQNSRATNARTSSSLSDPPSSGIIDMNEPEPTVAPTQISKSQNETARGMLPPFRRIVGTPVRTFDQVEQDVSVHQSQDRPKSNTALRIAPSIPTLEQSPTLRLNASRRINTRSQTPKNGGPTINADFSSPDYIHCQPSVQKTYGHHVGNIPTERSPQRSEMPQASTQESVRKRKSSGVQAEDRVSHRRPRSSSQSLPTEGISKTHQRKAPGTSSRYRNVQPLQVQGSASPTAVEPAGYSSVGPKRSKRNGRRGDDIERFEQELRPAQHGGRRGMR